MCGQERNPVTQKFKIKSKISFFYWLVFVIDQRPDAITYCPFFLVRLWTQKMVRSVIFLFQCSSVCYICRVLCSVQRAFYVLMYSLIFFLKFNMCGLWDGLYFHNKERVSVGRESKEQREVGLEWLCPWITSLVHNQENSIGAGNLIFWLHMYFQRWTIPGTQWVPITLFEINQRTWLEGKWE